MGMSGGWSGCVCVYARARVMGVGERDVCVYLSAMCLCVYGVCGGGGIWRRYPLPSSVLMTAVTAKAAGVKNVWVANPKPDKFALAAAHVAGEHPTPLSLAIPRSFCYLPCACLLARAVYSHLPALAAEIADFSHWGRLRQARTDSSSAAVRTRLGRWRRGWGSCPSATSSWAPATSG